MPAPDDRGSSHRPCRVCGHERARVVLTGTDHREGVGGVFSVVVCDGCGLARVDPWPDEPLAWYPQGYQQHTAQTVTGRVVETVIRRTATAALSAPIRRLVTALVPDADNGGALSRGATLLDVGAGNGTAVRALRAAGVDAHGLEPERRAVEAAHAAGTRTVLVGTLDDNPLAGRRWDVVRMYQTLEHMPDPLDALRRARALLSPAGRLVVGVPNFGSFGRRLFRASWDGLELPRHLYHFTGRSLTAVLERAGFAVTGLHTVALFGLLPASVDAATAGGERQRGWGRSLPLRAAAYPVELLAALAGGGDGLVVVARARD
ncbi:MAG: class I SAM-dependent methyltransferase [Thermoleophilia bacterium]